MNYKHIIGDLYEFAELTTKEKTSIRLSCVEQFEGNKIVAQPKDKDRVECTTVETSGGDHTSFLIPYEEFKELMKCYIEQEMTERAQMKYPTNIPSVWKSGSIKFDSTNSKWEVFSEDHRTQPSLTTTVCGEKKNED